MCDGVVSVDTRGEGGGVVWEDANQKEWFLDLISNSDGALAETIRLSQRTSKRMTTTTTTTTSYFLA